nr:MAG TPA: hypothetical protein [Caudoviricetes sp.]
MKTRQISGNHIIFQSSIHIFSNLKNYEYPRLMSAATGYVKLFVVAV